MHVLQMRFHTRILSINTIKKTVILERPLPFNVSTRWAPELHAFEPGITESGIEDMRIEFK